MQNGVFQNWGGPGRCRHRCWAAQALSMRWMGERSRSVPQSSSLCSALSSNPASWTTVWGPCSQPRFGKYPVWHGSLGPLVPREHPAINRIQLGQGLFPQLSSALKG